MRALKKEEQPTFRLSSFHSSFSIVPLPGKPIAVVEAKRTARYALAGKEQAADYADALYKQFGREPFIFLTNGVEIWFWDRHWAGPRPVQGFMSLEDLETLHIKHEQCLPLSTVSIDQAIVDRPYQIEAIRRVYEKFEQKKRKALLVLATGTGKTRLAMALIDGLLQANWIKRVLFLVDRIALVEQAMDDFKEHLPSVAQGRIEGGTIMAQLNGAQVTWLGHATFKVTTPQNKVILIDPWIEGNPKSPAEARQLDKVDLILVTHGHSDHINDVVPTAQKFHSQVVAMVETAGWIGSQGVENVIGFNIGGSVNVQGITVSMTPAFHSSGIGGKGEETVYGGEPVGYVIELENGLKLYHAGDTCAFGDMQLIRELYAPDIAMLPIGDFYTMGPKGAALSVRLLGVKHVIPMHYGTFPILIGTPAQLKDELHKLGLESVEVIEMTPGQTIK